MYPIRKLKSMSSAPKSVTLTIMNYAIKKVQKLNKIKVPAAFCVTRL